MNFKYLTKTSIHFSVKGFLLFFFMILFIRELSAEKNHIKLEMIKKGFTRPTELAFVPGLMVILEKDGEGKILDLGNGKIRNFIDLRETVATRSEEGLLSP